MLGLAIVIGLPVFLVLSGAGLLVEGLTPRELNSMGVDKRS
jgi:hypothetical protein